MSPDAAADAAGAVRAHLAAALEALGKRGRPGANEVHRFRAELKRARAGLRLLRDAVGEAEFRLADGRLREASRPLGRLRDADVAVQTVQKMLERRAMRPHGAVLRRLLAALRAEAGALRAAREAVTRELLAEPVRLADEQVARWRLPYDLRPILGVGVARVYRRGRRALALASARGTDASLHATRKHVKYLGSALAILAAAGSRPAKKAARRAFALGDVLGEHHDLSMLRTRLRTADRALAARAARRREKLARRALAQGGRLYGPKTRRFVERLLPSRIAGG